MNFSALFDSFTLAGQAKDFLSQYWQRFLLGMLLLCTYSVMSSIASTSSNLGGQAGTFIDQPFLLFLMFAALALLYNWPSILSPTQDIAKLGERLEARCAQIRQDTNRNIEEKDRNMTVRRQREVESIRAETQQLKVNLQQKLERDISIAHEDRRQWHEWASLRELHGELENKMDQLRKKIDTKQDRTPQPQSTPAAIRPDIFQAIQNHMQSIEAQLGQQLGINSTLLARLESQDGTISNLQAEVDTLKANAAAAEQLKYPIKNLEDRAESTELELEDLKKKVASLEAKKECRCVPAVATASPATQSTPVTSRISEPPQLGASASNIDESSSGNTPASPPSSQTPTTTPTGASISLPPSMGSTTQETAPTTTNVVLAPDTDRLVPSAATILEATSLGPVSSTSGLVLFESEPALLTSTSNALNTPVIVEFPPSAASGSTVDDGTTTLPEKPTALLTGPATDSTIDHSVNIPPAEFMGAVVTEPVQSGLEHLVEDAEVVPQQPQGENRPDISTEPTTDVTKSQHESDSNVPPEDHTPWQALAASCPLPQSPIQETSGDLRISEANPARPHVEGATTYNEQHAQAQTPTPSSATFDSAGWSLFNFSLAPESSNPPAARPLGRSPFSTVQSQPALATAAGQSPNPFKQRRLDGPTALQTLFHHVGTLQGQTQSQAMQLQIQQIATQQPTPPQSATPQPQTPLQQIHWRAPEPSSPQTPTSIQRQSSLLNSRNQSTNTLARTAIYTQRIALLRRHRRTAVAPGNPSVLEDRSVPNAPATGLFQLPDGTVPPPSAAAHDDDVEMREAPTPAFPETSSAVPGSEVELNDEDIYAPSGDVAMAEDHDVPSGDALMAEDDHITESMNDLGVDASAEPLPDHVADDYEDNAQPQVFSSSFFNLHDEQEAPGETHEDEVGADWAQHLGFNSDDLMRPLDDNDLPWLTGPGPVMDAAEGLAADNEGGALAPNPGYAPAKPQNTQPTANESSGDQSDEVQDSTSTNEFPDDAAFDLLNEWLSRDDNDLGEPLPGRRPQQ